MYSFRVSGSTLLAQWESCKGDLLALHKSSLAPGKQTGVLLRSVLPSCLCHYLWLFCVFLVTQGKYYLLLEHLSHLYRAMVPIPLWFAFFTDYNYGGEYFALVATTIFIVLKASDIM